MVRFYGLKQSGKHRQDKVTSVLLKHNYTPNSDASMFVKRVNDEFIILSLHVVDFLVMNTKRSTTDDLYDILMYKCDEATITSGDMFTYLSMSI